MGVGRADITIPPGASTFGHALDSRVANGVWTRAYCRVFFFQNDDQKLALIPCDLPAMSLLLQRKVADRVRTLLHPSQIMLTATHTHAGVGHFFGASQYTGLFSSRRPGFDEDLADHLADRIAEAIAYAERNKRPAQLGWRHRSDFWCYTRNRSLSAYQMNSSPYVAPFAGAEPECLKGRPDLAAVDPNMDVLRIDRFDPSRPNAQMPPIGCA